MTREQQREIGLVLKTAKSLTQTLAATSHCDEVTMEHLQKQGIELRGDYTASQRRRMAAMGQAMGDGSFPIATCADHAAAVDALFRIPSGERPAVEAFVARRALALGC